MIYFLIGIIIGLSIELIRVKHKYKQLKDAYEFNQRLQRMLG